LWEPFAKKVRTAHNKDVGEPESLLLTRAVPEVAEAMNASRVAIIASQERIAESQQQDLTVIRELLTGLTNGDVPLKIHVTAAFGPNTDIQHSNLEPNPVLTTANFAASASAPPPAVVSLQQSPYTSPNAVAPPSESEEVPQYTLQNLRDVPSIWREWSVGIAGNPAVRDLEEKFQHRWRPTPKARTAFCRRKVIWDAVILRMGKGLTEEEAVSDLETFRQKESINKLHDRLKVLQSAPARPGKRKRA
jgi:Transcriptional activator of glycolytic enzymes